MNMNFEHFFMAAALVVAFSCLQNLVNSSKTKRVFQLALIPAVFLFALAVSVVGFWLIDKIEGYQLNASSLLSMFSALKQVLASAQNLGLLLFNLAVIPVFVLIKFLLKSIAEVIWKKFSLAEHTAAPFYGYDEDYCEWFLYEKWVNLRKLLFVMYCAYIGGCAVYLGFLGGLSVGEFTWSAVFPCAGLIVLGEIYSYISGQTKREYEHSVYGDNSYARKISHYYKLREVLEKLLPEPLLSSGSGMESSSKLTASDRLAGLKDSDDIADVITAKYFEINDRMKHTDIDSFQATLDLMHRRNVVFHNPFYRDMTLCVTLPLVNSLLKGKKCAVIVGRSSLCDDVCLWMQQTLSDYSHMNLLWRVKKLGSHKTDCEVGVISMDQLYDSRMILENRSFLGETDFVMLVEPSLILNNSQTALSIIAREMNCYDEPPVYCIFDRQVDGLVDTLSHVLRCEITDVSAPPLPRCVYTGMTWDADGDFIRQRLFDRQTKYLGNGMELAAIAVKNQIPSVSWYCEAKAPVRDIKWIAGQYYPTICRYMNIPVQQNKLYEKVEFVSGIWSTPQADERFIIAEDEFCNMFGMMRTFVSRGNSQSFVNILSENYLLRDYMRCNRQMFTTNPDAVPSLVPDYAKTERNTLIKLLLMMTISPVSDTEVMDELRLVGIETTDPVNKLSELLEKYTFADSGIIRAHRVKRIDDELNVVTAFDFSVLEADFDSFFADSLKSAYYVVENEQYNEDFIEARMFNHVVQQIMPGQFVTYAGKYYYVRHISPGNGVILRRAADLYTGRRYYRQLRRYSLSGPCDSAAIRSKSYMDMDVEFYQADIHVETTGYMELSDNHDLKTANFVDLSEDPETASFSRCYRNKTVMRLRLRNSDPNVRFTFCLLLSEIFRSVFADTWCYLAVVSPQDSCIGGMLSKMVYSLECDCEDDEWVYIVEDSDIDLGLLEAVDRNLVKLMEIMADFLDWHMEKMREPAVKDPLPIATVEREKAEEQKRTLFQRLADRLRKLVGADNEKEKPPVFEVKQPVQTSVPVQPDTAEPASDSPKALQDENEATENVGETKTHDELAERAIPDTWAALPEEEWLIEDPAPELSDIDGTDIFDTDGMPEDNEWLELQFKAMGLIPLTKTKYQKECFLKFGFEEIDRRICVDELHKYLRVRGLCDNSLTKARKRSVLDKVMLDLDSENHCDFCGLPLSAVSYQVLNDGRCRCNDCASSAITTVAQFRELYFRTLGYMQSLYDIRYHFPIKIIHTDAKTVAKGVGRIFVPSTEYAGRVLGYAQKKKGLYSLVIENGAPRLAAIDTIVHELTHIWQYVNWNDAQIGNIYQMNQPSCTNIAKDLVYEGMAVWAAIQYLYQIGEDYYAAQQEMLNESRTDVYGAGFRLFKEQYPLIKDSSLCSYTPFSVFPPLDPDSVKAVVRSACGNAHCGC